jgi:small GTP-binding protein
VCAVLLQCLVYLLQLLDLPGIIEGAKDGKGRGRQVIAVARTCSLIFIVLDVLKPLQHKKLIEHELEGFGLRLNKSPPNIVFRKKDKGGVNLQTLVMYFNICIHFHFLMFST